MPGIDLMDLSDPLLKKRDKDALRLISHPDDSCPPEIREFWPLWTAKEAVFKAKRDLMTFDPKEIPVQVTKSDKGFDFTSGEYSGKIRIDGDLIVTVADLNPADVDYQVYEKKTNSESQELRNKVVAFFKEKHNLDVKILEDGNGLPIIDYKGLPVSFTHHGRYIAFAYPKI